jgi:hypothetical protein
MAGDLWKRTVDGPEALTPPPGAVRLGDRTAALGGFAQATGSSEILPLRVAAGAGRCLVPWLDEINKPLGRQIAAISSTVPDASSTRAAAPLSESLIEFDPPEASQKVPPLLHITVSPELTIAAAHDDARDAFRVQSRGYWDTSKPISKRFRGTREKTLRLYLL